MALAWWYHKVAFHGIREMVFCWFIDIHSILMMLFLMFDICRYADIGLSVLTKAS